MWFCIHISHAACINSAFASHLFDASYSHNAWIQVSDRPVWRCGMLAVHYPFLYCTSYMLTDLLNVFGRFRKYHSLFLYYTKFVLSYLLKISHRFQEYINNFLVLTQPNKFFYIVYLYFRYDRMRVRVRFTNRLSPSPFVARDRSSQGWFVAGTVCLGSVGRCTIHVPISGCFVLDTNVWNAESYIILPFKLLFPRQSEDVIFQKISPLEYLCIDNWIFRVEKNWRSLVNREYTSFKHYTMNLSERSIFLCLTHWYINIE